MRKFFGFAASSFAAVLLLAGCASIFSKSQYPVTISTEPEGALVTITNKDGRIVFSGNAPTRVELPANHSFLHGERYIINARKDGAFAQAMLVAKVDGWYFANYVYPGALGTLIVDPDTGAMWRLDREVHLTLASNEPSDPDE